MNTKLAFAELKKNQEKKKLKSNKIVALFYLKKQRTYRTIVIYRSLLLCMISHIFGNILIDYDEHTDLRIEQKRGASVIMIEYTSFSIFEC